jgi:hypothetical protein
MIMQIKGIIFRQNIARGKLLALSLLLFCYLLFYLHKRRFEVVALEPRLQKSAFKRQPSVSLGAATSQTPTLSVSLSLLAKVCV